VFQVGFEVFRTMVISGWDPLDYDTVHFDTREQTLRRNLLFYGTVKTKAVFSSKMKVQNAGHNVVSCAVPVGNVSWILFQEGRSSNFS